MPRASRGKEPMANSSWPTPTRWRDDGARGSPSLIWITTNCRGLWGEFQDGCKLCRQADIHSARVRRCVFRERQNGKAINGPSFMFWRSFGVKVNSFGTWTFGYFTFVRAHVCMCRCRRGSGNGGRGRNFNHRKSDRRYRRGYYFSIRSTDYITRLLFLTSLHPSYKNSRTSRLIFNVGVEDVELRIFFNHEICVYSDKCEKQCRTRFNKR